MWDVPHSAGRHGGSCRGRTGLPAGSCTLMDGSCDSAGCPPAHCRVQNAASTLAASPTTSSSLQPTHCGLWFPVPTLKSLVTGSRNAQGQTQSLPHSRPGSAAWAGGVLCGVTPSLKLLQLSNALSRAQCQLPSHPTDLSDPVLRQKIAALLQFLLSSYSSTELPASAGAQTAASGGECGFSSPTKNYPLLHMNKCYRAHGLSHHKPMVTVPKCRSLLGTGGRQGSSSPACPAPCLTLNSEKSRISATLSSKGGTR